jgi:hypothetical protein
MVADYDAPAAHCLSRRQRETLGIPEAQEDQRFPHDRGGLLFRLPFYWYYVESVEFTLDFQQIDYLEGMIPIFSGHEADLISLVPLIGKQSLMDGVVYPVDLQVGEGRPEVFIVVLRDNQRGDDIPILVDALQVILLKRLSAEGIIAVLIEDDLLGRSMKDFLEQPGG